MSTSHWVTLTANGANISSTAVDAWREVTRNGTVMPQTGKEADQLSQRLEMSIRVIEQAKQELGTNEYTPEVRERSNQIAAGHWAAGIPSQVPVVPNQRRVGSPAWLRD